MFRSLLLLLLSAAIFSEDLGIGPVPPATAIWSGGTTPTNGYILFSNGTTAAGDASLAWDSTNKRATIPANLKRSTFTNAASVIGAGGCYHAQVGTMSASRAVTLPAATVGPGAVIVLVDESGSVTSTNTMVATRAGSDTINGGTTWTIGQAYGRAVFVSDGTSKWTVASGTPARGTSYVLYSSGSLSSHTGDTSESTLVSGITLPANAVAIGGSLTFDMILSFTASTNLKTFRTKLGGTSLSTVGFSNASNVICPKRFTAWRRDATTWVAALTDNGNSYTSATTTASTITADGATDLAIVITTTNANSGETSGVEAVQITVNP
jgi:hypothetical protein